MDTERIQENKEEFKSLCRQYIQREGLDGLLAYLEQSDFYTAPSSKGYHLNEDGGLCQHSINVFRTLMTLYDHIVQPAIVGGKSAFTDEISTESLAISALFHDLCKVNIYHKAERWKRTSKDVGSVIPDTR